MVISILIEEGPNDVVTAPKALQRTARAVRKPARTPSEMPLPEAANAILAGYGGGPMAMAGISEGNEQLATR